MYRRHEYFGRRGGPAIFMGYIEEGGVRYAVTDDAGRSHTVGFCFEGDFAADYSAFVQGRPALVDSVAIQDTRMWVITRRQYFDFIGSGYDTCLFGPEDGRTAFSSALTTGCWDSTS
ncbi:MAG: cyclic nucleotide-binding domain-containing protein [Alistipes putredinis]|nr:MAG: cyclic nucleotide-binding domain-containing protein [Alistipes putredinis]